LSPANRLSSAMLWSRTSAPPSRCDQAFVGGRR
jgi:hypothetical protein